MSKQQSFDIRVSDQAENLSKLVNDEIIGPKVRPGIMIRKFWYRLNLYRLYKSNHKEKNFSVLHLGCGKDKMCEGFEGWNIVRADREEFEGVIKLDLNSEYEKIPRMCEENDIKLVIMEGLTYYLEKEALHFILEYINKSKLYFILDGLNEESINFMKLLTDMKTHLPLELLPPDSKISTTAEMEGIFGKYTKSTKRITYYALNF